MENNNWEIAEDWFVKSPTSFFHIGQVEYIHKDNEKLSIAFHGALLNFVTESNERASGLFEWLVAIKTHYAKAIKEDDRLNRKMRAAQLEIQNKLAGHVVNRA